MTLEDFKIGCEQFTRDELIESLYNITKQNNKAIDYITTEQLYTNYSWGKSQYAKILKDLLNILKGEDKE